MKAPITNPTYNDVDRACYYIVAELIKAERNWTLPKTIVGLSRGGLIPAVIISHMLENHGYANTVVPVSYSSKAGNGDGKNHDNILPKIDTFNLLIVDDIVDGGHTMKEVAENYQYGYSVRTAALYYKNTAIFKPDFYRYEIDAETPWIVFPFE